MNKIFFFLFSSLIKMNASITFESGFFDSFDYRVDPNFMCRNLASYTKQLKFSGTFANTPQFIISSYFYDLDLGKNEFTFSIQNISTTNVNFTITSPQPNLSRTYRYKFLWIAMDDQRIEVINSGFNQNVTGLLNKQFTFPHSNINALKGFICATSFGYNGSFSYSLKISSISQTEVKVEFTQSNYNLLSIGFQVVLGTVESLDISQIITTPVILQSNYTSSNLLIPNGYNLTIPLNAMSYEDLDNIRYRTVYNLQWPNVNYTLYWWGATGFTSLSHQYVWINVDNPKIYQPFIFKKMRVTREDAILINKNLWQFEIKEINKLYTTLKTETIYIDKDIQTLTLTFTLQCFPYLGIKGTILKCLSCINQYQSFLQYCYNKINLITFRIILYQPDSIYQYINVIVTETGFTITESVINQFGSKEYTVISLLVFIK